MSKVRSIRPETVPIHELIDKFAKECDRVKPTAVLLIALRPDQSSVVALSQCSLADVLRLTAEAEALRHESMGYMLDAEGV